MLCFVPQLGSRSAELAEMPFMLVVAFFSARWVTKYFSAPPAVTARLAIGIIALICMLILEFSLVLFLQELTLSEYFAKRDPISGSAYIVSLIFLL